MGEYKHFKTTIETQAAKWAAAGEEASLEWDDWDIMVAKWWSTSDGGKAEGLSPLAQRFVDVCFEKLGHERYQDLLSGRDDCVGGRCGYDWKIESLSFCTSCRRGMCYQCKGPYGKAPNGNYLCRCKEGELVG